jgi:hypothetical protein
MSSDSDPMSHGHALLNLHPATRRRWPWFLLLVILALACAAGVYAWPEIATLVPSLAHEESAGGMTANDKQVLPDILASQQKSEEDLAALGQAVSDQHEQLKIIVDQLLALTSKVEALQRAAPPALPAAATEPPRAPITLAVPRPRKPPSVAPKPSGPISTGGTPLSVAPGEAR